MPQLVSNLTVDNLSMQEGAISGNGKYHAYRSNDLPNLNNKAIEAVLQIHDIVPDREGLGRARVMFLVERKDDAGNYHPVHSLFSPVDAIAYGPNENGGIIPDQQLSYGPNVFNFDGAVSIDVSDGIYIISQDHQKRGILPDTFRLCVIVHERDFGNVGAFQSISFSIDYELRSE